jgi:hypothetical protein
MRKAHRQTPEVSALKAFVFGLVWVSVTAAVAAFFLPWATLDVRSHQLAEPIGRVTQGMPLEELAGKLTKKVGRVVVEVKRGTALVTGELPDLATIPTRVSGVQIPQLANRQDAQVVLALAEMLTGQRNLGAKSYWVYLVPALALLCGLVVTLLSRLRLVCLLVGGVCLAVSVLGFWKLLTTNTETLLVAIDIGPGLWLSLWAYVGLGLSALSLTLWGCPKGRTLARAHKETS